MEASEVGLTMHRELLHLSDNRRFPFAGIIQIRLRVRHTLRWCSQPGCPELP